MSDQDLYAGLASKCHPLWQMRLMGPSGIARFARDRGAVFWDRHIESLWQIGLLRADLVVCSDLLTEVGMIDISGAGAQRIYSDQRPIPHLAGGWTSALTDVYPVPDGIQLLFHPFRYYVLSQLDVAFGMNIASIQALQANRYVDVVENQLECFRCWSAREEFTDAIAGWNDLVMLAVLTEPCEWEAVLGSLSWPAHIEEEIFRGLLEEYRASLGQLYDRLDAAQIQDVQRDLCVTAEVVDRNRGIHTLLRLGSKDLRTQVEGTIGGVVLLKMMAEMIRRAAEHYYQIRLPEEDEAGFGLWTREAKRRIYGTDRIFDGDRAAELRVVRQSLLDYSTRLRWYVEGETECGAIRQIIGHDFVGVEVIDLGGHYVEKRGKGLAFRKSLLRDQQAEVFSFVSLDEDRADNIRVVQTAARKDEMFGHFFISRPDFEFANFTLDELEEVIWGIAEEAGAAVDGRPQLKAAIAAASTFRDLESRAKASLPQLNQFSKGLEWGKRLGEYAWENKRRPDGIVRPVVKQIEQALRVDSIDFRSTREGYRVDPETGMLIER